MSSLKRSELEKVREIVSSLKFDNEEGGLFEELTKNYDSHGGESKASSNFVLTRSFDLTLSDKEVFVDDHDNSSHVGLLKQQLGFVHGKPVYLIDNHNNALYAFLEIKNALREKLDVVHIDAHRDDAVYPEEVEQVAEGNLQYYLNTTRVSDYLDVAKRGGLINEIVSVTQSFEFESFQIPKQPYILNLDIDIYGEEGAYVETRLKTETILKAWENAEAVIFATSPGFIPNEDVKELAEIFLNQD